MLHNAILKNKIPTEHDSQQKTASYVICYISAQVQILIVVIGLYLLSKPGFLYVLASAGLTDWCQ